MSSAAIVSGATASVIRVDPLRRLSDRFPGSALGAGWSTFEAPGSGLSVAVANSEANIAVTAGSTGGSFWFNEADGCLLSKSIAGPAEMRAAVRVRNLADNGLPVTTGFRIFGIAVHDPNRTGGALNYVHVGFGSSNITTPSAVNSVEWKTTDRNAGDGSTGSCYGANPWTTTNGSVAGDLRIVRRRSDLQIFDLYARMPGQQLEDDSGWLLQHTINRADNNVPDRNVNPTTYNPAWAVGGASSGNRAVSLPTTCDWGLILYSSIAATPNVRGFCDRVLFRTPA